VEDRYPYAAWRGSLTWHFSRDCTVLNITKFREMLAVQISHGGSEAFKSPHLHPTSALVTSPMGRFHWPTPFEISPAGIWPFPQVSTGITVVSNYR
jgi:hypothetical protein